MSAVFAMHVLRQPHSITGLFKLGAPSSSQLSDERASCARLWRHGRPQGQARQTRYFTRIHSQWSKAPNHSCLKYSGAKKAARERGREGASLSSQPDNAIALQAGRSSHTLLLTNPLLHGIPQLHRIGKNGEKVSLPARTRRALPKVNENGILRRGVPAATVGTEACEQPSARLQAGQSRGLASRRKHSHCPLDDVAVSPRIPPTDSKVLTNSALCVIFHGLDLERLLAKHKSYLVCTRCQESGERAEWQRQRRAKSKGAQGKQSGARCDSHWQPIIRVEDITLIGRCKAWIWYAAVHPS
eukprot:6209184-Pleurochrysis_carterae.AAC.1